MINSKIIDLFCDVMSMDEDEINRKTLLNKESGFEPIDIARLVIAAEEKFHITIYDEHVGGFQTVGDMIDYIEDSLPEPDFSPEELIYE